jgi:molybdopterin synthase catalytic subunit
MKIHVEITREVLLARGAVTEAGSVGAVVEFAGVVRGEEDGAAIAALNYEAYDKMARSEMERIALDLSGQFPCESIEVIHRIGRVAVGETSILVRIEAKHRAEAFGMLAEFMNRMKTDVPIWKKVLA